MSNMARTKHTREELAWAQSQLEAFCPKGRTVYTVLKSVSRSGMCRRLEVLVPYTEQPGTGEAPRPELANLTGYVGILLGRPVNDTGLRMDGCGMDMGFALVHDLAQRLYGDGYALKHRWV